MLLKKYKVIAEENGSYLVGPNKKFTLGAKGLEHIFKGEFTERLVRADGKRVTSKELVLKGGLHTYKAWIDFKNKRTDIVHFRFYDSDHHNLWYYARKLQNGTILLKIPKEAFQSKAAELTKFADTYYKSGYLWKTLFPEAMTDEEIIASINESLHNVDNEESQDGTTVGYSMASEPFRAIKIRTQIVNNEIISAFPTWGQPMTGNDGKPYSHADTIALKIALSTELFDDSEKLKTPPESLFPLDLDPKLIKKLTPDFIKSRPNFDRNGKRVANIYSWNENLEQLGKKISCSEANSLLEYIKDWQLSKDTSFFLFQVYNSGYKYFKNDGIFINCLKLYQNVHETLRVLFAYDQANNTNNSLHYINYYLHKKLIHAGFLDLWESKRIINLFIDIVLESNQSDSIEIFINNLSVAPLRAGILTEFDLNPFLGHDDAVIGITGIDIPLHDNHFYKFCAQNLGENYVLILNEEKRIRFAKNVINSFGPQSKHLVTETIKHSTGLDFEPFSCKFDEIVNALMSGKKSLPRPNSLESIIHDYYRFQISQIYRITLEKRGLLAQPLDYSKIKSKSFQKHIKAKHERDFVTTQTSLFLDSTIRLFEFMGEESLKKKAETMKKNIGKVKIPMPKKIPDYISSWMNNKSTKEIVKKYNVKLV